MRLNPQVSFNLSLKFDSQRSRIASGACRLVLREFGERLGLCQLISNNMTDARRGKNTQQLYRMHCADR